MLGLCGGEAAIVGVASVSSWGLIEKERALVYELVSSL